MKGGKVKFLQAAPRADLRPPLETPPCAVAVAGAFLFVVAGARCTALGQNSTFHHGGDLIKKVSFGLLASILLRAFTSLNQPITRRAIVIYCYDAHAPEHC